MSLENAHIMNVISPTSLFLLFPTNLAIGGTQIRKMLALVNTMLFTGWELKIEKTTKSRIPLSPPKQRRSHLAAVYCCEITGGET